MRIKVDAQTVISGAKLGTATVFAFCGATEKPLPFIPSGPKMSFANNSATVLGASAFSMFNFLFAITSDRDNTDVPVFQYALNTSNGGGPGLNRL